MAKINNEYTKVTLVKIDKEENFTNDDIFNYLRKLKEYVNKDSKALEKKVDSIEMKIEQKLERMQREFDEKIKKELAENKKDNVDIIEEFSRRVEQMESMISGNLEKKKEEEKQTKGDEKRIKM